MTTSCTAYAPSSPPSYNTSNDPYEGFIEALKEMLSFLESLCKMGIICKFNTNGNAKHIEVKTENVKDKEKSIKEGNDDDAEKITFKHVETKNAPEKKNLLQPPPIDTTSMTFDSLMLFTAKLMGIFAKMFPDPKDSKKVAKAFEDIETTIESKISTMPTKDTAPRSLMQTPSMDKLFNHPHKRIFGHPFPSDHTSKSPSYFPSKMHTRVDL